MSDIIENLTDMERDHIIRAAWESNPRRAPYDEAIGDPSVGRGLMDVARDAFAAVRAACQSVEADGKTFKVFVNTDIGRRE